MEMAQRLMLGMRELRLGMGCRFADNDCFGQCALSATTAMGVDPQESSSELEEQSSVMATTPISRWIDG